jgi:DNA-binding MarR family transcriptional regulator
MNAPTNQRARTRDEALARRIECARSERDRRGGNCTLTTRGREALTERHAHVEQRWQTELAEFSTDPKAEA